MEARRVETRAARCAARERGLPKPGDTRMRKSEDAIACDRTDTPIRRHALTTPREVALTKTRRIVESDRPDARVRVCVRSRRHE